MLRRWPLRHGWQITLVLVLLAAPWLEEGDATLRVLLFRLRGPRQPPPELVILDVDEDSVALGERLTPQERSASSLWRRMGPWPWPRELQADLAAAVLDRGARQVVFTVLFPHPSTFGPADDKAFLRRLAPWRDRVVLVAGFGAEEDPESGLEMLQLRRPVYELGPVGLDVLLEGPLGAIEALPGKRWQHQALADLPLPHPPALAFAAVGREPPDEALGLDFLGPAGTVPVLSAWQVQQQPPDFWRDRIVLIGRTPSRLADRRVTPFGPLSSVEFQSAALATVLERRGFRALPIPMTAVLLLIWGWGLLDLLRRPVLATATAMRALFLSLTAFVIATLAWWAGWWLPVTALTLAPLLGGGSRALVQWRGESRERAYLYQVLARRVSPALLADILRTPGPLGTQLGGSKARCAVLFTDLVGFTPLSSHMEPVELFALLNRYFEAISSAVIAEDGLLDKFIGDALMAEFGVPRSRGDAEEARAAVRAALAMQTSLEQLNAELKAQGGTCLRQGIGIHFGDVMAGNLGSSQRLEFTVIGASVNLASRLEGLTRQFPQFPVLLSDAVLAVLPDELEVEALGEHWLKGWPEPVAVYGLRGLREIDRLPGSDALQLG